MLFAGLDTKPVVWLRAWFRYLRQTGSSFGLVTVVDALRRAPKATLALVGLFTRAPRPGGSAAARAEKAEQLRSSSTMRLTAVRSIDDDRILRRLRALVEAILRTNAFAQKADEALAFKINSSLVPGLPAAGAVARNLGLQPARRGHPPARRSDRSRRPSLVRPPRRFPHRDPRPDEGAAGQERGHRPDRRQGRLLSQAAAAARPTAMPGSPKARKATGSSSARCCRSPTTSSTTRSSIPTDVVIHDGDDPYFVVAADKGTATFSDVANAIALERNFWLGDAFASGGSQRLRPQGDGDHRQGRAGSPSSATSSKWASTSRRDPMIGRGRAATCRATCSATACCCRRRSSWSRRSTTATSSSTPIPIRQRAGTSASACSTCRGRAGTITIARSCRRAAASIRARRSRSS